MPDKVVIDFSSHMKKKQNKQALKECIAASGWSITNEVIDTNSEACVYLIDKQEDGVLLFGCKKADFPEHGSKDLMHWGQFVLAWDVIVDPDMAFDEVHKQNTMRFALRSLPRLSQWSSFCDKAFNVETGHTVHILIIIDRQNLEGPWELIVAHSKSPVMNSESIQSILDGYLKS